MILLHCMLKEDYESYKNCVFYGEECIEKEGFIHCSTWNSFYEVAPIFVEDNRDYVLLCIDSDRVQAAIQWEDNGEGILYPHIYGTLNMESVVEVQPLLHKDGKWNTTSCIHVLMNTSHVDEDWCFPILSNYIHSYDQVCIVAFSFWEDTMNKEDWNKQYRKDDGVWYKANTDVWKRFGIDENQVVWVNYFEDSKASAKNKILNSSVVFFTGGAPDLMMNRIKEFELVDVLTRYQGVMVGYSAGAMIQMKEYHITPDMDYSMFSYEEGLPMLEGFDIEVHYEQMDVQHKYIQKVMEERHRNVYALYDDGGILVKDFDIEVFGKVDNFLKESMIDVEL